MRSVLIVLALIFFFAESPTKAEPAAFFTCEFLERPQDGNWTVVDSRSCGALLDSDFQFSMGNFSYQLTASALHDTVIQLHSQVFGNSNPPRNFFRRDVIFRGAAVFFDSALVRAGSVYRIRMQFDSLGTLVSDCEYRFAGDDFRFDPSGDFDFYFIRQSLGDYRWNEIRDAFERDYDGLVERFQFSDRTKTNFYISPCRVPDVGWDPRWDNALDYARHSVFAHFTHGVNELHPEVVYMLRLMRVMGYSPAFLHEGMVASLNYAELPIKALAKSGQLPEIASLSISRDYRALDRNVSLGIAGSFVNFLLNTRGRGKLVNLYQESTDLTLPAVFERVYNEPLANVEAEWRQYVDTVSFTYGALSFFASRAQMFMKTTEILPYARTAFDELKDTAWAPRMLSSLYYTFGEFEKAAEFIKPSASGSESDLGTRIYYANLLLSAGKVDEAAAIFAPIAEGDSVANQATAKLAQIEQFRGNVKRAMELMQAVRKATRTPGLQIDYDLVIGDLYFALGRKDSASAYFQLALDNSKVLLAANNDNPLQYLRVGKAALRLGSIDVALEHLEMALFLEERMFYVGQILLAMGQAKDLKKDRKGAKEEYQEVLRLPTAYLDRHLAQDYLKTPFKN